MKIINIIDITNKEQLLKDFLQAQKKVPQTQIQTSEFEGIKKMFTIGQTEDITRLYYIAGQIAEKKKREF